MEYKKKLRKRLYISVSYLILGIGLNIIAALSGTENYFFSCFGSIMIVMGLVRILRHIRLTGSDSAVKKQEIAETDERNRMMAERARAWAFSFTVLGSGVAVIVLSLLGYHDAALPFAWLVCGMTTLYWLSWLIIRRKY